MYKTYFGCMSIESVATPSLYIYQIYLQAGLQKIYGQRLWLPVLALLYTSIASVGSHLQLHSHFNNTTI